jgi:chromosome condensin MukBEF MukE localization factor
MKYEPIYRVARQQFQNNHLNMLVGQVLLYHFFMNEPFHIAQSIYPELANRDFPITDEMLSSHEFAKILCLNDNYLPPEDLRDRAIFLIQVYLEERALDTEPELQKIYQRIVDDKPNSN